MEDRRKSDEGNWKEIISFIAESREFRKNLEIKVSSIEAQTIKTNGRVDKLEYFQEKIETKIQDKKDANTNWQGKLSVGAGLIAALSAVWAIFKK